MDDTVIGDPLTRQDGIKSEQNFDGNTGEYEPDDADGLRSIKLLVSTQHKLSSVDKHEYHWPCSTGVCKRSVQATFEHNEGTPTVTSASGQD